MSFVSVRDMTEYLGFVVSYDDDQDWYEFCILNFSIFLFELDADYVDVNNVKRFCVCVTCR